MSEYSLPSPDISGVTQDPVMVERMRRATWARDNAASPDSGPTCPAEQARANQNVVNPFGPPSANPKPEETRNE